ncbi:MAG: VanZ family protein [Candidatus Onthomonas sp.]
MGDLFQFIYVQPLYRISALALLLLLLWHQLREPLWRRAGKPWLWRLTAFALLLLWVLAVLYVTLLDRSEGGGEVMLTPFWSYRAAFAPDGNRELLRSNLMNVLLFLPGGLLLGEIAPRDWRRKTALLALGLSFLLSAGVEILQGVFSLGIAETDDVIHNVLGGLLGSLPAALSGDLPANTREG